MNDLSKEEIDKIMAALSQVFGADNIVMVFGGPEQGLKMVMRKDVALSTETLRMNVVAMINESFEKIVEAEREQSKTE